MNNDILRLAIVINTSHSTFLDNLCNVILYTLYINRENRNMMSGEELHIEIKQKLFLEFTEEEIQLALNNAYEKKLIDIINDKFSLNENGLKKIHQDNELNFDIFIKDYRAQYNIKSFTIEQIKDLVLKFLYCYINENIEIIESMINGPSKLEQYCSNELSQYSNEEREIVNNFIDWPNIEKDKLVNKFLHFTVDYCRLTVRKDSSNFNDLLKGKKFYLDTNIIFRLMGLNGEKRQRTTQDFIIKCQEVNIKLIYTNITKKETFDSIKFHVKRIRDLQNTLNVTENKLYKLIHASNYCDGINEIYYSWSIKNNSFGKYGEFVKYLQGEFYKSVKSFEVEVYEQSAKQSSKTEDMTKRLLEYKHNNINEINVEYDVQNILHVENKRRLSGNQISWNISHYLISADHYLVSWANSEYKTGVPIVVLPSVWYSMILRITGRSDEGYKSFVEFIKLKYIQHDNEDKLSSLITCIRNRTDNGLIQEMIIDEIVESNIINNNLQNAEFENMKEIVDKIYDNSIELKRKEGYENGYTSGIKVGKDEGIDFGTEIGRKDGLSKGLELGEIKANISHKLETIEDEINKEIKKRIRSKKIIKRLFLPSCIVLCVIMVGIIYININITSGIISTVIALIINTVIKYYIEPILIKTDESIRDEERNKRSEDVMKLKDQLKNTNDMIQSLKAPM